MRHWFFRLRIGWYEHGQVSCLEIRSCTAPKCSGEGGLCVSRLQRRGIVFLTRDELRELTGYKQKSAIARFLRERGYRYDVDKDGWPKLPRMAVETRFQEKLGGPRLRLE